MCRFIKCFPAFCVRSGIIGGMIGVVLFSLSPDFSFCQSRYSVLITELLADPTPAVGLPESEFIELTSHSRETFNLHNWTISNGRTSALIKNDFLLKPDSLLILCSLSAASAFQSFGPVLGINGFPSLNNEGGSLILYSAGGEVIHAIQYDQGWFHNDLKAAGGWSLEMIDLNDPCSASANWTASLSVTGGTPGKKNSVNGENPDGQPPSLIRAEVLDSLHLILDFDEPLDESPVVDPLNYSVSDGIGTPDSAAVIEPFFDRVKLRLKTPLQNRNIYSVTVQQITDCSGNEIGLHNQCKTGIAETPKNGDIIFNEILFNPPTYGYDYLELYNAGSKTIDCAQLFLAGRDFNGNLKDPLRLFPTQRGLYPGDYLLLTENPDWILHNYPDAPAENMIRLSSLPAMPDDLGRVVLLNASGDLIDELDYDHHWHSPLLAGESGVSLERIRPDLPTNDAVNWTSAAANAGYGTPGYKNSESADESTDPAFISLEHKIFSPDMDGVEDFCFIQYHLPQAGFIGSVSVYDIYGRRVRLLVNNVLWSVSGRFRWDGLDDQQNLLSTGHYIIYVELFLPDGTVKTARRVCTLARRY